MQQRLPYRGRSRFTDVLVRDALYQQLSQGRRALLHQQVGQALETVHADDLDPHLTKLGHHFLHWFRSVTRVLWSGVEGRACLRPLPRPAR